jgi:hypothetical protein
MAYPKVRFKPKKKRQKPDQLLLNKDRTKQERLDR